MIIRFWKLSTRQHQQPSPLSRPYCFCCRLVEPSVRGVWHLAQPTVFACEDIHTYIRWVHKLHSRGQPQLTSRKDFFPPHWLAAGGVTATAAAATFPSSAALAASSPSPAAAAAGAAASVPPLADPSLALAPLLPPLLGGCLPLPPSAETPPPSDEPSGESAATAAAAAESPTPSSPEIGAVAADADFLSGTTELPADWHNGGEGLKRLNQTLYRPLYWHR